MINSEQFKEKIQPIIGDLTGDVENFINEISQSLDDSKTEYEILNNNYNELQKRYKDNFFTKPQIEQKNNESIDMDKITLNDLFKRR